MEKFEVTPEDFALLTAVKKTANGRDEALVKQIKNEYHVIELKRTIKERVTFTTG